MTNSTSQAARKKMKAAQYFTKQLINNPQAGKIKTIVLFGSVAKGEADQESDLDILIFSNQQQKLAQQIWQASLDTYEKFHESVEPMVYKENQYSHPDTHFLYQAINKGKTLYHQST